MNYSVPAFVQKNRNATPPSEMDFPLYNIHSNTENGVVDLITLTEDAGKIGNHFMISAEAKGGSIPVDQNIYDSIATLPSTEDKYKLQLPIRYQSGEKRCLGIPDGFWSNSYTDTTKFGSSKKRPSDLIDRDLYSILPKEQCPSNSNSSGVTKVGEVDFFMEEEVCRELGGSQSKFDTKFSTSSVVKCNMNVCKGESLPDGVTIHKLNGCPPDSKVGRVSLPVLSETKCSELGGNIQKNDNNSLICEFDLCNTSSLDQMFLFGNKKRLTDDKVDTYGTFVNAIKSLKSSGAGNSSPIRVSFLGGNSDSTIKMEPCRSESYLSTNYRYSEEDQSVRTLQNPNYCISAPTKQMQQSGNPSMFLTRCNEKDPKQSFNYNEQKQIVSNTVRTPEGKPYCVNANFNNSTSFIPCEEPIPFRQKWELESHNKKYCIRKGGMVLVFEKQQREERANPSGQTVNPPIDNLLSERFDSTAFHYWILGKVIDIKNGHYIVDIKVGEYEQTRTIPVTSSNIVPEMDIEYELNQTLKKGDKVLVQNGNLIIRDSGSNITIPEKYIFWEGIILEKNTNIKNMYKVALSINSSEPNENKKPKMRPEQAGVKNINLSKIRFRKLASICMSSIN